MPQMNIEQKRTLSPQEATKQGLPAGGLYTKVDITELQNKHDAYSALRREYMSKLCLYKDVQSGWNDYVVEKVEKMINNFQLRADLLKNFQYINILKQIIDTLSSAYQSNVKRVSDDELALSLYEDKLDVNLLQLDRYSHLFNTCFLHIQLKEDKPFYEIVTPNRIYACLDDIYQNDVQRAEYIAIEYYTSPTEHTGKNSETVYLLYRREEDGLVYGYKVDSNFNILETRVEKLRDYPITKLDLDPISADFFPVGNDNLVEYPIFCLALQSYIVLSFKYSAVPVGFTTIPYDKEKGPLSVGPGSLIQSNAPDQKFEFVSSSSDHNELARFVIDRLKEWAKTYNIPSDNFNISSELSSGIARQIARKPLSDYINQRVKVLEYFEQQLYHLVIRFLNDCNIGYSLNEDADFLVKIEYSDVVQTPKEKVEVQTMKFDLAQKMVAAGLFSDIQQAMELIDG